MFKLISKFSDLPTPLLLGALTAIMLICGEVINFVINYK